MGAKKKKNLANKLAKMSDEERARYMQHRADVEEEARRRKEQLIATFMKNKLKREEAFARLNLAKINQYWHQILRKSKCKEMKEEVEHMRKWIERTLNLKNKTIDNLIQELDESEEQYCTNLQAHLEYIDNMTEYHMENIDKLNKSYEEERDQLIEVTELEKEESVQKAASDMEHLKTVAFGQGTEAKARVKIEYETHMTKKEELICEYRNELEEMARDREKVSAAIWKQIAAVLRNYVQETDKNRAHLAELVQIDANSALEISANQERIKHEEERLERLKLQQVTLKARRSQQIRDLEEKIKWITKELLENRKYLNKKLARDDKNLRILIIVSNDVIGKLERFKEKGEQVLFLIQTCSKFETEEEKLKQKLKWDSFTISEEEDPPPEKQEETADEEEFDFKSEDVEDEAIEEVEEKDPEDLSAGVAKISAMLKKTVDDIVEKDKMKKKAIIRSSSCKEAPSLQRKKMTIVPLTFEKGEAAKRPKTAFLPKLKSLSFAESFDRSLTRESSGAKSSAKDKIIKEITISNSRMQIRKTKSAISTRNVAGSKRKVQPTTTEDVIFGEGPKGGRFLKDTFESLQNLDELWHAYNSAYLDLKDMREEKKILLDENKNLRGMIRSILEAAALDKTNASNSKISTRVGSRYRGVVSAPTTRIMIQPLV